MFGTGKYNDPRPMKCDVFVYKLSDSDNFVQIYDGSGNWYYGGNQNWYSDTFNQSGGCGCVAAANILAYMAKTNAKYGVLYPYKSFNDKDFISFMTTMCDYVKIWNLFGNALGVWPASRLTNGVTKYAKKCGIELSRVNDYSWFNLKNVYNYIKTGLEKDLPVAMLIGLNAKFNNIEYTYPNGTAYKGSFERHWVTITELEIDEIQNTHIVKVSSWGCSGIFRFRRLFVGKNC